METNNKLFSSLKLYFVLLIIEGILGISSLFFETNNAFIGIISLIISILSIVLLIWSIIIIRKVLIYKLSPKKILLVLPIAIIAFSVMAFSLGVYSGFLSQEGLQSSTIIQSSILIFLEYFAQLFYVFQIVFASFVLNKIKRS